MLRWRGGGSYFKKEGQECVPISSVSIPPDGSSSVQPQSQRERCRFHHVPGGSSVSGSLGCERSTDRGHLDSLHHTYLPFSSEEWDLPGRPSVSGAKPEDDR